MKKSVLFMPLIPACFAVAALCSPIQAYSIELAAPNDEVLISSVVSTDDDSIEADGAFEKDSEGCTEDAGDITPGDAQTPAMGDDGADTSSPALAYSYSLRPFTRTALYIGGFWSIHPLKPSKALYTSSGLMPETSAFLIISPVTS